MKYSGTLQHHLKETINDRNSHRGHRVYMNFLPIIQSSGMGKSRMVDELAKSVFTIPFILAANDTSGKVYFTLIY
jgi:hypothetical protein